MRYIRAFFFLFISICIANFSNAQTFLGNYSAENTISLVRDNPCFALSNDRAQINAGFGVSAGGNFLLFNRNIYSFLTDGLANPGTDYIKNPKTADRSMSVTMEILGPGASFTILKKYTFAVTTGIRYLANADHLDNNTFMRLGANAPADSMAKNNFNISNFSLTSQIFKELNLSYATFLKNNEDFSFSVGGTLKILAGVGALGMGVSQANFGTINNDGIAYGLKGNANFAFTPYANKFALFNSPLNAFKNTTNNIGAGLDLGVIYTIHINNTMHKTIGYQARFAASITDIGGISYSASSTSGSYNINNKNINYKGIQNYPQETFGNRIFNEYLLDTLVKATSSISKFRVGLPTALHLNADINVVNNYFFINGNLLLNLRSPDASKYVSHYTTTFTLTPRYMLPHNPEIGFAMPFSYNAMKQGGLGIAAYIGPFYIGSSSVFNSLISNSFSNVNLYMGFSWRIRQKRQKEKDYMMM